MSNGPTHKVAYKCRHTSYPGGIITKCGETAVLHGYCVAHVPDQITRQHFTRTLTAKVLRAVKDLLNEAAERGGLPSQQAVDNLAVAFISLEEWRRL